MKKLFFSIFALCMGMCTMAQSSVYVYQKDGKTLEIAVSNLDSISFTKPVEPLSSVFSVSADKTVKFAPGNLQYTQSTKKWEFATNQYDILGESNVSGSVLADKIDLFGWSANNTTAQWGISTSATASDYSGDFVDWGKNIGDGNTWRTLSKDEWYYLFYTRTNAATLFGLGSINGINGTIILPDNWVCPSGITFNPSTTKGLTDQENYYYNSTGDNFSHNTFTLSQWEQLEQAGAVFLPAADYRSGASVNNSPYNGEGNYWSSTANDTDNAYLVYFGSYVLGPRSNNNRNSGKSVRLVQDVE